MNEHAQHQVVDISSSAGEEGPNSKSFNLIVKRLRKAISGPRLGCAIQLVESSYKDETINAIEEYFTISFQTSEAQRC